MSGKFDVYEMVNSKIVAELDKGVVPWHKPWKSGRTAPMNLVSQKPYRGVNVWLLNSSGFSSPYWVTFNQAKGFGGSVRTGEKSTAVVFWNFTKNLVMKNGKQVEETIPFLRYYNVFNVEQCEGIDFPLTDEFFSNNPIDECEKIVNNMPNKPKISHDSEKAYYSPTTDSIGIPKISQFETAENYYGTLFHELIHSTGHDFRLNRGLSQGINFGSEVYSKEELVAEFGAAFLCGMSGIFPVQASDSAAYISGWLEVLKSDRRLLVQAASSAQKAADYILSEESDPDS